MNIVYQLWGVAPKDAPWDELPMRLETMLQKRRTQAVIVGLDAPRNTYERICGIAKAHGAQVYLWLPVFSEWDHLTEYDPLIDYAGNAFLSGHTGAFHFRCPQSGHNIATILEESDRRLRMGAFDGVFLDRIRYPSFQYGLSGVLGCFCEHCQEAYRAMGLDIPGMKAACERAAERKDMGLLAFDGHRWQVEDENLQALLDARRQIIADAIKEICDHFRAQGLKIGLDLFTPSLGYFAGQDLKRLLPMADFVKPMMYLRTDAPAGLPYELARMDEALAGHKLLSLCGAQDLKALVAGEVEGMARVKRDLGVSADILCGTEINRVLPITPVTPETIREDVRFLKNSGVEGITTCWNLFSTPQDHVDALLSVL